MDEKREARSKKRENGPTAAVNDTFRIDRLTLKNFRCFEEKTIEFHPRFNVLIGDNGSGKTAVLEAIARGLAPTLERTGEPVGRKGVSDEDIRRRTRESAPLAQIEPQYPLELSLSVTAEGEPHDLLQKIDVHTRHAPGATRRFPSLFAPTRDVPLMPLVAFYGATRYGASLTGTASDPTGPEPRRYAYAGCLEARAEQSEFLRVMFHLELMRLQEQKPSVGLEVITSAVAASVPRVRAMLYRVRDAELTVDLQDESTLPFRMLPDGVRTMLAMAGDMARRALWLNPDLGADAAKLTPGVVLIDEIDLHLHPSWQRHVVDDLKRAFPKVQFVVTTHSPFIIQSAQPGEVYDLESEDGEPRDSYSDQSIEDIADKVQRVEQSAVSENRRRMTEAGRRYYQLLARAGDADPAERRRLKRELDQIAALFSDNVAYHAQLAIMESDREARGLGDGEE